MIPIALILLLIVIVFSIAVVVSNPAVYELSIFGAQIPVQTAGVYFTGAGAMLVLIVALGLLRVGWRRSMARRKQVKTLKKAADGKAPAATADRGAAQPTVAAKPAESAATTSAGSTSAGSTAAGSTPATGGAGVGGSAPTSGEGPSTSAEREALLAEVDDATRDDPKR